MPDTIGDLARQDDYTTPLAADDINDFKAWKQKYAPNDSGYDYDLPGAYKAGLTPDTATGHFDDQFKKPNHPTFSTFSQYAKDRPDLAGTWQGDQYIPPPARSDLSPDETQMQPPVSALDLPPEAYASLGGGDLGLLGSKGIAGLFDRPSWLQKAQDLTQKDVANYQTGGVPAMMGDLAADSSAEQDLAGGFGGNIKGVKPPVVPGALATLGDYHPPFYSAVERAVAGAKQTTAPGQQWAGYLRNQPGVKPEEVETLGLGKLFEQPGSVSKDAVLGEIAANKVNVGEVVKGAPDPSAAQLEKVAQERYGTSLSDPYLTEGQRMAIRDEASNVAPTKFSSYTLPGGENYREMLLTLPSKVAPQENAGLVVSKSHTAPNGDVWYNWQLPDGRSGEHIGGVGSTPDTVRQQILTKLDSAAIARVGQDFKSSHFDEPNVLAHVRYNDRVIDGKKTLFVEEVQSDWHQKGKRQGYTQTHVPQTVVEADGGWRIRTSDGRIVGRGGETDPPYRTREDAQHIADVVNRNHPPMHGVPDAPFKTTWPDLAMKRIIREAAEKGYDKVAWTPGSVQADRYDLSKQINQLDLTHNRDGVGKLGMTLKDGSRQYVDITSRENLADTVGKDVAEKLYKQGAENNGIAVLSGLDLKVGGEGMKGFYDEILPATVNKLVKKHGTRVGEASFPEKWQGPEYGIFHGDELIREITTKAEMQEARDHGYDMRKMPTKMHQAHSIDITPSLRAAAMKGFPLFTAGGVMLGGAAASQMGDLAKQDEYR